VLKQEVANLKVKVKCIASKCAFPEFLAAVSYPLCKIQKTSLTYKLYVPLKILKVGWIVKNYFVFYCEPELYDYYETLNKL